MKTIYLIIVAVACVGLMGCGKSKQSEADKAMEAARQSFDSAPEPLKTQYQEAVSALNSGDLLKAKAAITQLLQSQLTPEQLAAVTEQKQTLVLKASTAAQNGDAIAMKIIQEMRSQSRSR
jgi:hypothetical protein